MLETRLYQLLEQLTEKTLVEVLYLLKAPHIKNREILHLFEVLKGNLARAESELTRVKVFKSIYPGRPYNDQKLRLLSSQLLKKIESHLVCKRIQANDSIYQLELLRHYKEENLKSHYESQLKKSVKLFEKNPIKDSFYHDQLGYLEEEVSNYLLSKKRNQPLNLQRSLDQTDVAFIIKKLKIACSALAHKSVYSIDYNMGMLDAVLKQLKKIDVSAHPAIEMYYTSYKMLKDPEDIKQFNSYRLKIKEHQHCFHNSEIRNLYLLGINVCIRRLNKGEKEFGRIGLKMYEEALQGKHLLINGKLTKYTYRNITMMAIRADDFDWAIHFTETYKDRLKKSELKSSYHLNKALIYYHQKELELARDNIIEADFNDHLINLAAKSLQAKIYFELQESFLLDSHLDSMEMYIIRKKIIGYHKQNYKTFISFLRKLIRLQMFDMVKREKLKAKINAEKILIEKSWFLSQLESKTA